MNTYKIEKWQYAYCHFSVLYVFILDRNSLGPDDGPIRTETCSPTVNKVYIGHLLVVLDGCFINILTLTQRYGEHKKFCKITYSSHIIIMAAILLHAINGPGGKKKRLKLIINQSVCGLQGFNISEIKYPRGLNNLNTKIYVTLSVFHIILTARISYYSLVCGWQSFSFSEGASHLDNNSILNCVT